MSLLKETTSQIATFDQIILSGTPELTSFSCSDISCTTLVIQDKVTTNQFQLASAGSPDGYVLTSDTEGNGVWSPAPAPVPVPSLAYGSLGGITSLTVNPAPAVSFNLNHTTSPELINRGVSVSSTGFIIETSGVYELNFCFNARNGTNTGTTQFIEVGLTIYSNFTYFQARSTLASVDNGMMMCAATWICRFSSGDLIQLMNIADQSMIFDASNNFPSNYSFNRYFSIRQLN